MQNRWLERKLAWRLIIGLTLFSSLVTLCLTALQLYAEFQRDIAGLDQRINEIKQGYSASLVTSLWLEDDLMLQRQLQGIVSLPDVVFVEIRSRDGETYTLGTPKTDQVTAHRVTLLYSDQGTARTVGTMTLIATLDSVYASLWDRVWIILAANGAKTLVVCAFLFVLVQYLVTRHLTRISRHLSAIDPDGKFEPLRLDRKATVQDELTTVVTAINDLQRRLSEAQESLRSREAALKSNVTQLKDAKSTLEERGRMLERLAADFDDARAKAETSNRSKTEFLANMSHELRTPLNAIIGFAEIVAREMFGSLGNAKYRAYANDIIKSSTHLLSIVNDMLDLSRIESGKVTLQEEVIDLHQAVTDALEFVRPDLEGKALRFHNRMDEDLPLLRADKRILRQILLNLLSNALKFTPPGGRVTARAASRNDGGVIVTIEDTGMGIPASEIDILLKPFGLAESSLRHDHEGTGLGLPLCKVMMELHGGELKLASQEGIGTTVSLVFPADRTAPPAIVQQGA